MNDDALAQVHPPVESAVVPRPPKAPEDRMDVPLGLRIGREDMERLTALQKRLPALSRHAVARAAMRIGIAVLEKDPSQLLEEPPAPGRKGRK